VVISLKKNKTSSLFNFRQILAISFFLSYSSAFAAGAYLVDDGGIADKNKLQVENWYSQSNTGEAIIVTNPTYQLFENAEFAVQESYNTKPANFLGPSRYNNTLWPQVKYLWHNGESALSSAVFGVNYSTTENGIYGSYAYIPTTIKLNSFTSLHLYVGWQNWRHSLRNNKSIDFLNYGSGLELHYSNKLSFVGEYFQTNGTYRIGPTRPAMQLGSRYLLCQNLLLDMIIGKNINGNRQHWLTFGATVIF